MKVSKKKVQKNKSQKMSLKHQCQGGTNDQPILGGTNGTLCADAYTGSTQEQPFTETADCRIEECNRGGCIFLRAYGNSTGGKRWNDDVHDAVLEYSIFPMR